MRDAAADFRELVVRERGPRAAKAVVRSRAGLRAAPAAVHGVTIPTSVPLLCREPIVGAIDLRDDTR